MDDNAVKSIPLFRDAVAERAKVSTAAVDVLFSELNIAEEKATRRAESLAVRRLMFTGEKRASGFVDGRYTFEWSELAPGLWGVLSDGTNQVGKSTVLEVMLWALRGRPRGLKPEVRAWIDSVEMDFSIGLDRYRVAFTDMGDEPRGTLMIGGSGPLRTIDTFDGEERFTSVMGELMMGRFALQPIPNVREQGADGSPTQYFHSWDAYVASMFIEGSHPAILGDVTVGALWWRMLNLFVGSPYASMQMAISNALVLEQAGRASNARSGPDHTDDIRRLQREISRHQSALASLGDGTVSLQALDKFTLQNADLARGIVELENQIAEAERAAASARSERDEARAVVRRLQEGVAAHHIFAGLKPVCCPRCSAAFPESRAVAEEQSGKCAVCDRDRRPDDADEFSGVLSDAQQRVNDLSQYENAARQSVDGLTAGRGKLQEQRGKIAAEIAEIQRKADTLSQRRVHEDAILKLTGALDERKMLAAKTPVAADEDRLKILQAAAAVAVARMRQASSELFVDLEQEVVAAAQRFGFHALEAIAIRGNGIMLTVSGVSSSYSKQTAGQRLRLRIAIVVAMMRLAERSGFGHHPGVLFIDSPGSEEVSEDDLLAMIQEIGRVAIEIKGLLQVFVASARGELLGPAFETSHVVRPGETGTIF